MTRMKRSAFKANPVKVREFVQRGRAASARSLNANPWSMSGRKSARVVSVALHGFKREEFRDEVAECRVVGCGGRAVHQHHVIFRQHVEREHGDRWHPGNALGLCLMHHGEAHGLRRLDVSNLRDENYAFAAELFGVQRAYLYLRRYYVGDDPRLDALMVEEAA